MKNHRCPIKMQNAKWKIKFMRAIFISPSSFNSIFFKFPQRSRNGENLKNFTKITFCFVNIRSWLFGNRLQWWKPRCKWRDRIFWPSRIFDRLVGAQVCINYTVQSSSLRLTHKYICYICMICILRTLLWKRPGEHDPQSQQRMQTSFQWC